MSNEAAGQRGEPLFFEWRGTPFEIGVQQGRALGDAIRHEYQPALASGAQSLGVSQDELLQRFAKRYLSSFQQYAPTAVEEIRGMAHGAGLDFEHAFFAATRDGAKWPSPGSPQDCTTFFCAAATTANNTHLLGQTKDTASLLTRYRIMRSEYSDGRRVVLLNYPGWIANIGLNSYGVACSANSLYAASSPKQTVPFSLLRRVINEAESVAKVMAVAQEITLENGCMIVADRSGAAISIEYVGGERCIEDVSGRAYAHANSILCADLKVLEAERLGSPSSPMRQRNADRLLEENQGHLSVETLQKIMADHSDYPYSLCRHATEDDPIYTTAAFVADLTNLQMHIAIGHACVSQWHTYQV